MDSDIQQIKEGDIPKHLRPLVRSRVNLPIPTPTPEHGIRIQIPAIDVDAPIVHDEIIVYTSRRSFTYVISGWELVEPTQVEVMAPTSDATITLISCHPYLVDNHRIVVKGSLAG